MISVAQSKSTPRVSIPGKAVWMAGGGFLAALIALLTLSLMNNPFPSQDLEVFSWITGLNIAGLADFSQAVSLLTNTKPALVYGMAGMAVLLYLKQLRLALLLGVVGTVSAAGAVLSDYSLGELVGRIRPLNDAADNSYPSGHVFGATVFFGFLGFLAIQLKVKRRYLVPLLMAIAGIILAVGPSRIYEQAHWPSDVAAGYLLGALWLLIIIPPIRRFMNKSRLQLEKDAPAAGSNGIRIASSIASLVILDPQQGTATKVYRPPMVVRVLYWLAFQSKFPYSNNRQALLAGEYRRKIASMLTIHRFGKDLVSPVTAIEEVNGEFNFVTEFVPGDLAENNDETKAFLAQVTETFAEAGLSVWQVNPRNPHAHTNVIRTPEGDFKIIDLESAVVTPFLAKGQWRSAIRSGNIPVFDDIDFLRLRDYIASNEASLEASLGADGLIEFKRNLGHMEYTVCLWKDAEPRVWGKAISRIYGLLAARPLVQRSQRAFEGADRAAQNFLNDGIERWEREGRIDSTQIAEVRTYLASGEVQDAIHHMGAHMILSVAIAIPIPGLRSLARAGWTAAFWAKVQLSRLRRGSSQRPELSGNIHTPLVMLIALLPILGGAAYFASKPLRRKILVRLILDQTGQKLPFKLYARMRLARWLAPAVISVDRKTVAGLAISAEGD